MFNAFSGLFVAAIVIPPAVVAVMALLLAFTPAARRSREAAPSAPAPDVRPRAAA